MHRMIAMLTAGLGLLLGPTAVWAQSPATTTQHLEHLMVENADTPQEHLALARYYRMKAADAMSLAEEHRLMGKHYRSRQGATQRMKQHCERIAELNEELASEYESLAKGEDIAARK